jgi:hypothetical protein
VADPERNSTSLTGWYWYHGVTPEYLAERVAATGARIIDLEVQTPSPLTFSAALVGNSGTYSRGWYWYYGLTAAEVASQITAHSGRIIDLERYVVSGQQRFAIVMVVNTGVAAKSWWYYNNASATFISQKLSQHGARLIDLDSYTVGDATRYSAVMIRNSGVDAKSWWWYLNVTPAFVSQKLTDNHARLIDVERRASGRLDVVMQRRGFEYWWWYYNLTAAGVAQRASQNGARIADIETYLVGSSRRYAVLLLNDLNAESSRLREIMRSGLSGGSYGVSLKKVGGAQYVGLQQNTIFEPASSIKVLYHLYAMRSVMNTSETLSSSFDYWRSPTDPTNKDVCPDPTWETDPNKVTTTLQDGLAKMMQVSDNRTTRGMDLRYGRANVNDFADDIGMSNTEIRQIVGCGFNNGLRNDFTLVDAGKLYEGVSNGTQLSGTDRTSFWNIMNGGAVSSSSGLAAIVRDEATKLGKTPQQAASFISNMNVRSKGGSYDVCNSTCSAYTYIRTAAGRMTLPFKSSGSIVPTDYVYGRFIDGLFINCAPKGAGETVAQAESRCLAYKKANAAYNKAGDELFRTQVRAALQTW